MNRRKLLKEICNASKNLEGIDEIVDLSGYMLGREFTQGEAECFLAQYNDIIYMNRLTALYRESFEDVSEIDDKLEKKLNSLGEECGMLMKMYGGVLAKALASVGAVD